MTTDSARRLDDASDGTEALDTSDTLIFETSDTDATIWDEATELTASRDDGGATRLEPLDKTGDFVAEEPGSETEHDVVFVGGWGAAQYQYAYEGSYG